MEEIAALLVRLQGDGTGYQKMLAQAQTATTQAAQHVEKAAGRVNSFGFGMRRFALQAMGALGPLAGALSGIGGAFRGVQLAAQAEQMEIAFEVLVGNAEKAKATLADLRRFAETTPFEMPEVVAAAKQAIAFGQAAEDIVPTMRMLGDISSGLGIPLGQLTYLFGTLQSQGRAFTVDINQFAMRGVPIWKELEKQFGKTNAEVRKLVEKGQVGFADVQRAFQSMTGEGGKFGGMMEKQSQSVSGLFSTMTDAVNNFLRNIGDVVIETFRLKDAMKAVIVIFEAAGTWVRGLSPEMKNLVAAIAATTAAVAFFTLAWPMLAFVARGALSTLFKSVDILLGPINLLGLAVFAVAGMIVQKLGGLGAVWDTLREKALAAWEWVKPVGQKVFAFLREVGRFGKAAFDSLWKVVSDNWEKISEVVGRALEVIKTLILSAWKTSVEWVVDFARKNGELIFNLSVLAAGVLAAVAAFKVLRVTLAVVQGLLVALKVQQAAGLALWLLWKVALLAVSAVVAAFTVQTVLWTGAAAVAKVATLAWTAALVVLNALLAPATLLAIVGTVGLLAAAIALVGSAAWAAYQSGAALFRVLSNSSAFAGPLAAVGAVFREWGTILKDVWKALQVDGQLAWKLLQAGFALAVAQIRDLWPPLWEFLKAGFAGVGRFISDTFRDYFDLAAEYAKIRMLSAMDVLGLAQEQADQQLEALRFQMEGVAVLPGAQLKKDLDKAAAAFGAAFGGDSDAVKKARAGVEAVRKEIEAAAAAAPTEEPPKPMAGWLEDLKKMYEEAGKQLGAAMGKGTKQELQKADAALFGSAEAASRLAAFADVLSRKPGEKGSPVKDFTAVEGRSAEGKDRTQELVVQSKKQTELLKKIAKKPGIELEAANLS